MNPERLPRRLEELEGLRAARWIRESSSRQGDKYGPGAQREMQDRALERFGLIDTGLSWMVLKSGWSGADSMKDPPATQTADFQAMLRAAERGDFDVLLVGYTSRFLRDVHMTLHYRKYFHLNGVVVVICDDGILTSNPNDWERLIDKVKGDEQYSRTHSRNVRTGYAEKRRSAGDPGGQPPLGFRRAEKLLAVDPDSMATVRRAFELSASGKPDHEVADNIGATIDTVRHVLTNPIYIGRLRDGLAFRLGATIDLATWNLVADRRERRRTRVPGVAQRRCYALKLRCQDCGLALHGHEDRYRHAAPACAGFRKAKPTTPAVRGRHGAVVGTSYPTGWYEGVMEWLLRRVAIPDETAIRRVLAELGEGRVRTEDQVTLARIARARTDALRRLEDTRDIATWQATVVRLDAEEEAARAPSRSTSSLTEDDVRGYLANLARLWGRSDAGQRQQLSLALFDEVRVLGFQELSYQWSKAAESYGLDRLVPADLLLDIGTLGLAGGPTGEFRVRRIEAGTSATAIQRAG